ncbi:hypothetical protein [Herbiconiux daphne]|uniref:DUF559 domain-containing protein n=1 Tax=Herbiconiux daphne TaxID=2970914 RepID=A0ABT2GYV2_9MICO|nr:hypothetical protein [Herbiconiux daphne]MCS5733140.1 hypothetical protein [Herbiconiux daphne]
MPKKIELPEELAATPFSVEAGRDAGLTTKRMLGADLERPFHGVRSRRGALVTLHDRCLAYAERLRPGDFFSHTTAAQLWGCPLPSRFDRADAALHVSTMAPSRAVSGRGVIGHRVDPDSVRVVMRHGLPVSDAASTWCDLAAVMTRSDRVSGDIRGLDDLVAAGDHLVYVPRHDGGPDRPYLSIDDLARRVQSGFRRRGNAVARVALELVRDGAESRPETLVRLAIVRKLLPEPVLNEPVLDRNGNFIGRADMRFPDFRVIVEYDGEQHRTDDEQYARDERRIEDFQMAGEIVVRIRKDGLARLSVEAARVERALRSRGWTRPLS